MSSVKANKPIPNRLKKTSLALLAAILLVVCFRQNEGWVERIYSNGLYRWFCYLLRPLFNILPFSAGDIIYLLLVAGIIAGVYHTIRCLISRQFYCLKLLALKALMALATAWLIFYLFWGLNYYRPAAAQLLALADTTYNITDVVRVTSMIIDSTNACRERLSVADIHATDDSIYATARTAVYGLASLSPKFKVISPRVKPSLISFVLNYMGTSGYYNPFTSEAQINNLMPVVDRPFVACHEMSHQTGWAREDEANFAGYLAGVRSHNRLLRYSAYYAGMEEFMRYLRRRDTSAHKVLRNKLSALVIQDLKTDSAYWTRYEGGAEVMSGILYDKFLKANNQPQGLRTYNRMILLTMAWYRRQYHIW